jgi:hypothetical protein
LIPQADLSTSSTYYASVIYTGSGTPNVDSTASTWKTFTTASSFAPAPGTLMDGGYFGGQINDGGIIYNLIVADAATGQNTSGLAWKNAASSDTNPPSQNAAYGFPMSQLGFVVGAATYPALHWARSVTASGYNDWYLPAKNELETLYYFLKPQAASGGSANDTASGSNPNAVAPEPVSTNYTATAPAQTTSSLFVTGTGTQAFSIGGGGTYWASTQSSINPNSAWSQNFVNGSQDPSLSSKPSTYFIRAIRRTYANAPVAIGAAFGGGYFAGQYRDGGITYNLIVAPETSGGLNGQFGGATPATTQWKNAATSDTNPPSQNEVYGKPATDTFGALGSATYPMFAWCLSDATGPNGGAGIGGHTDWYIPAKNELAILVYNLGPSWTTAADFKATGAQAFAVSNEYWSASEASSTTGNAWVQSFADAAPRNIFKSGVTFARAVRRVQA